MLRIRLIILFIGLSALDTVCSPAVVLVSIPKSGTHLLGRCVEMISGKKSQSLPFEFNDGKARSLLKTVNKNQRFFWGHLVAVPGYFKIMSSQNVRGVLIVRDPRDQIISVMHHLWKYKQAYPIARLGFDELFDVMTANSSKAVKNDACWIRRLFNMGSQSYYQFMLGWMELPNFLVVRYEDLVGSRGGGSDEAQAATIHAIANHIGVELNDDLLSYCQENLYGKKQSGISFGCNFREGIIGSWQRECSLEQQIRLQNSCRDNLIMMGYPMKDFS